MSDADAHVLVVEDDAGMAESLVEGLRNHRYVATAVGTGAAALAAFGAADVVLLDLNLPDLDGKEICRLIREQSAVPIIVITARSDEVDRVVLLELGADDYVVKPFGLRELVARVGAVLRRARGAAAPGGAAPRDDVLHVGTVTIDRRRHRVEVAGEEISLTPKEFELLVLLAEDPGAVRTREEIIDTVWDPHWFGPTKTLDVHVASLRRKLGGAITISARRGVGYRLEA